MRLYAYKSLSSSISALLIRSGKLGLNIEPFVSRIIDGVSRSVSAKLRDQKAKFITGSVPVVVNQQSKHILGMGWIFDDVYAENYIRPALHTSPRVKVSLVIIKEG